MLILQVKLQNKYTDRMNEAVDVYRGSWRPCGSGNAVKTWRTLQRRDSREKTVSHMALTSEENGAGGEMIDSQLTANSFSISGWTSGNDMFLSQHKRNLKSNCIKIELNRIIENKTQQNGIEHVMHYCEQNKIKQN